MLVFIYYKGHKLGVSGTREPAEIETNTPERFIISDVSYKGDSISDLLEAFDVDVNILESTVLEFN